MTLHAFLLASAAVVVWVVAVWVWVHCAVDDEWGEPTAPIQLASRRHVGDWPEDAA